MKITNFDKIKTMASLYTALNAFSSCKKKISLIFRPFDAPRYTEFAYLKKFADKNNWHDLNILDVSSPYMMAYIFAKNNHVLKTDIDGAERKFIEENKNLSFKIEDATRLTFSDNTFDLVYSVSVIEHIYENYARAVQEMIRVTKTGGYVYLTFPVSKKHSLEWLDGYVYERQHKSDRGTFFQYRFDEGHVKDILDKAVGAEIIEKDIFWEKKEGAYDVLIDKARKKLPGIYINFFKDVLINLWYGFTLLPMNPDSDFKKSKSFGNMHLLLKKKQ